jgi:glycosyltransferase involved in cell wall biosynthesis
MQPLVSVVVPVYNVERYVAAAIQSVFGPNLRHF